MTTDLFTKLDPGTAQVLAPRFLTDGYDLSTVRANLGEGEQLFGNFIVTEALAGNVGLHAELQIVARDQAAPAIVTATVTFDFTGGTAEDIVEWTAHALKTGDPVRFTGSTPPAEIIAGTTYYVIELNANEFQVASSLELALDGTVLAMTDDGSGTVTGLGYPQGLSAVVTFDFTGGAVEDLVAWVAHGHLVGTPIRFTTGASGVMPTGIVEDETYFITAPTADYFQLSTTLRNAMAGTVHPFTTDGTVTNNAIVTPAVIGHSVPIPKQLLALGSRIPVRLDWQPVMGSDGNLTVPVGRYAYARVLYTIPGGVALAVTAGMFRVDIIPGVHGNQFYGPSGFSITGD